MSKDKRDFHGIIGTPKPHETADRLAEEFHKDMKRCRVIKVDGGQAQVSGDFKKKMSRQEIIERTLKAMEG